VSVHRIAVAAFVECGQEIAQHEPEGRRLPVIQALVAQKFVVMDFIEEEVQPGAGEGGGGRLPAVPR